MGATRDLHAAPQGYSTQAMLSANPDLLAALAPDWKPPAAGVDFRSGGQLLATSTFGDTLGINDPPRYLNENWRFPSAGDITPEGQAALDAFYGAPLSALETSRTLEGEQALAQRAGTEWFLTLHGLGPEGSTVPDIQARDGSRIGPATGFTGNPNLYNAEERAGFLLGYGLRGPASEAQVDRAGRNAYRAFTTEDFQEEFQGEDTGLVLRSDPDYERGPTGSPSGQPAGSFDHKRQGSGNPYNFYTSSDLLLDSQNIINSNRQLEFGGTPGRHDPPPPAAVTAVENLQQARRKRKQLAFAARGRSGAGGPPRSGLLVGEGAEAGSGVGKLSGGTTVGV